MTFSLVTDQIAQAQQALEAAKDEIGYQSIVVDEEVAKVSIVGIGMRSHAGVAQKMFAALAEDGINIKVITTSEIKVSVLIDRRYMELAVQTLHKAFDLEAA
jgi:aspartate kinase